jgi:hypothetical protein
MSTYQYLFLATKSDIETVQAALTSFLPAEAGEPFVDTQGRILTKSIQLYIRKPHDYMFDDRDIAEMYDEITRKVGFTPTTKVAAECLEDGFIHFGQIIMKIIQSTDWDIAAQIWGFPVLVRIQGHLKVDNTSLRGLYFHLEEMFKEHGITYEVEDLFTRIGAHGIGE